MEDGERREACRELGEMIGELRLFFFMGKTGNFWGGGRKRDPRLMGISLTRHRERCVLHCIKFYHGQ